MIFIAVLDLKSIFSLVRPLKVVTLVTGVSMQNIKVEFETLRYEKLRGLMEAFSGHNHLVPGSNLGGGRIFFSPFLALFPLYNWYLSSNLLLLHTILRDMKMFK